MSAFRSGDFFDAIALRPLPKRVLAPSSEHGVSIALEAREAHRSVSQRERASFVK